MSTLDAKDKLKKEGKSYKDRYWTTIGNYKYKFYATNDFEMTSEGIAHEYNGRGNAEKQFSYLKQEFNVKMPPFENMNANTVFFIVGSLANNFYGAMIVILKPIALF